MRAPIDFTLTLLDWPPDRQGRVHFALTWTGVRHDLPSGRGPKAQHFRANLEQHLRDILNRGDRVSVERGHYHEDRARAILDAAGG